MDSKFTILGLTLGLPVLLTGAGLVIVAGLCIYFFFIRKKKKDKEGE